jgi:hypothetical protein
MRLSDIRGDDTIDIIADCIEPLTNIALDPEAAALFAREGVPEGTDVREYAAERLKRGLPLLLKSHKRDIVTILAALHGEPYEEYAARLDIATLLNDIAELLSDEVFAGFFGSVARPNIAPNV